MTPLVQIGIGALMLALSYVIILAGSTVAFVIVDRRYEIFPVKAEEEEESEDEED